MFARILKFLAVFALVISLGGHWAILQAVAWAGMAANFSQTDSLPVALSKTFGGKNPCQLCKLVTAGKKAEKKSAAKVEIKQLESSLTAHAEFYFPPQKQSAQSVVLAARSRLEIPRSPPPKSA